MLNQKYLQTVIKYCTSLVLAYILCLWPWPAGPSAALLRSSPTVLHCSLGFHGGGLAVRWLHLIAGPRTAWEEPPAEAAFVWCVPAAFHRNATWTGYIGCFWALPDTRNNNNTLKSRVRQLPFFKNKTDCVFLTLAASITSNSTTSPSPTLRRNFLGLFFLMAVCDTLNIKLSFHQATKVHANPLTYLMNKHILFSVISGTDKTPISTLWVSIKGQFHSSRGRTCLWNRIRSARWTTWLCLELKWLQWQVEHE